MKLLHLFPGPLFAILSFTVLGPFLSEAQPSATSFRWAQAGGGTNREYATDVAVDPAGNSHIIGKIHGGSAHFGSVTLTNDGLFIAMYDRNGTAVWAKGIALVPGWDFNNLSFNLATDDNGNTYVGGLFAFMTLDFGGTILATSNYDLFLAKYDPLGNLAWARTAGGPTNNSIRAFALAADANGNCYLTGDYMWADTLGLTNRGHIGYFVAKFDTAGSNMWARPIALTDDSLPDVFPVQVESGWTSGVGQTVWRQRLFGPL